MNNRISLVCFHVLVKMTYAYFGSWMNQSEQTTSNEWNTSLKTPSVTHLDTNQSFTISKLELENQNQKRQTLMMKTYPATPYPPTPDPPTPAPMITPAPTFCPLSLGFILLYGDCRQKGQQIIPERTFPPRIPKPAITVSTSRIPPPPKTTLMITKQQQIIPETTPPPRSTKPAIIISTSRIPPPPKTTLMITKQQQIIPETTPPPRSTKPAIIVSTSRIPPPPKTTMMIPTQQQIIPETTPPPRSTKPAIIVSTSLIPPTLKTTVISLTKPPPTTHFLPSKIQQSGAANTSKSNISQLQTLSTKFPENYKKTGIRYHVYDEYKNISREVKCFKNFLYKSGNCMSNASNEIKLIATLFISRLQNAETSNGKYISYVSWLHLLIATHFSEFKLATVLCITIFQNEKNSMFYKANVEIMAFPMLNLKEYVSKLISLFHEKIFSMTSITKKPPILRHPETNFQFQFISNDDSPKGFKRKLQTEFMIFQRTSKLLTYSFRKTLFCPMVVLGKDEVIFNNKSQLCLITFDVCFDSMLYYVGESVQICMEDYFSKLDSNNLNFSKLERKEIWVYRYTPEGILSLVLMCISSLSLLITLSIYFVCPELRSLPGKCIMFLSVSLLIAQLLFQFGITLNDYPVTCKVVGFIVHYAWLTSFFWMSASSIQIFLQFGRFVTRQTQNSHKRLLKYCLYAFGCPFLLIATNIGYSLLSSDGKEYGYGLDLCYISYPIMAITTFITPAFLVTATNIILFVIVCCRIRSHENIQSVKSQLNKSKVIVKLSCLTGSLWIVGFINYWLRLNVLEYLFILLNASQGVFIMVSFVCTKRVFSVLRQKCKRTRCKKKQNLENAHQTSF